MATTTDRFTRNVENYIEFLKNQTAYKQVVREIPNIDNSLFQGDTSLVEVVPQPLKCEYCRHSRWPIDLTREHNLTANVDGQPVIHGWACKVCLADYWRDRAQAAQLEMAKAIQELRASTERLTDAYQKAIGVLTDGRV